MSDFNTWTNKVVFIATLMGLLAIIASCGSSADDATEQLPSVDSTDTATAEEAPPSTVDPDQAMADFQRCMSEQGVALGSMDDADGDSVQIGNDVNEEAEQPDLEALDAAQEECSSILDGTYSEFELSPEEEAELADENLATQRCLRDKGYDITVGADGSFEMTFEDDEDPAVYQMAFEECAS